MNVFAKLVALVTRRFYPRGTQRLLKIFFSPNTFHFRGVIPYDGNLKIAVNTAVYVEWELFFRGYYEKRVIDLMKKLIADGAVAMDVGANVGTHTLVMAKLVGSAGKVFAFDPDPESLGRLRENISLNAFTNIKVLSVALSDHAGKASLFSYSDKMTDHGTASLYGLPKLEKGGVEVGVKMLDTVVAEEKLNRLDFIKIDTRGSDFPIIKGARESIRKFNPYIVFEYNEENWNRAHVAWEDVQKFFHECGYELYLVGERTLRKLSVAPVVKTSYNVLAVPKGKLSKTLLYE